MPRQHKEGKRMLSPQLDRVIPKRSRSIYVVESPGGTMRETDPANYHPPAGQAAAGQAASESNAVGSKAAAPKAAPKVVVPNLLEAKPPRNAHKRNKGKEAAHLKTSGQLNPAAPSFEGPSTSEKAGSQKLKSAKQDAQNLSIRDKLLDGVAKSFANKITYENATLGMVQQQPGAEPQPRLGDSLTVAGLMRSLDIGVNMEPSLSDPHYANPGIQGSDMINHVLTNRDPLSDEPSDVYYALRNQHFDNRMPHVLTASQRLQAVSGAANYHNRAPILLPEPEPGNSMLVDDYGLSECLSVVSLPEMDARPNETSLMAFLASASRRFGYKKLELDSIVFQQSFMDNMLVPRSMEPSPNSAAAFEPEDVLELDAIKGSLTVYEIDIVTPSGIPESWTWFKIRKPLVDTEGSAPLELFNMPESVLVFIVRTSQVQKTKHPARIPDQPASLGDFGRLNLKAYAAATTRKLTLKWKFSKNGIPTFAVTRQPQYLAHRGLPPDFLWVDCAPYYSGGESWWHTIRQQAINNRAEWNFVQQLMSGNNCLVEVKSKPGASWIHVAPTAQEASASHDPPIAGRRYAAQHPPVAAPPPAAKRGLLSVPAPGGRGRSRRGKGTQARSGLRNEVRQD
ncbi:hypothetical protein FDECE_17031 [Fusarium decemcellulare]|nr:hypothetical protein FDECE_17031 [Fusarium decemcellulare]